MTHVGLTGTRRAVRDPGERVTDDRYRAAGLTVRVLPDHRTIVTQAEK
jgi:hypothetical protein